MPRLKDVLRGGGGARHGARVGWSEQLKVKSHTCITQLWPRVGSRHPRPCVNTHTQPLVSTYNPPLPPPYPPPRHSISSYSGCSSWNQTSGCARLRRGSMSSPSCIGRARRRVRFSRGVCISDRRRPLVYRRRPLVCLRCLLRALHLLRRCPWSPLSQCRPPSLDMAHESTLQVFSVFIASHIEVLFGEVSFDSDLK